MEMTLQQVLYISLAALALALIGLTVAVRRSRHDGASKQSTTMVPAPGSTPPTVDSATDDVLIAVITAAVTAMWQGNDAFIVRRVRRVHNSPAWQQAGREIEVRIPITGKGLRRNANERRLAFSCQYIVLCT